MFAIIKTGGKQYVVQPGDKIKIEKLKASEGTGLDAAEGEEVSFDALLVSDKETLVGTPYVAGYKVKAKVLGQGKGKKIIVYKYKAKKRYHKKQGHRQRFTEIEILSITKGVGGAKKVAKRVSPGKSATPVAKKKVQATAKKASKTPVKKAVK